MSIMLLLAAAGSGDDPKSCSGFVLGGLCGGVETGEFACLQNKIHCFGGIRYFSNCLQ